MPRPALLVVTGASGTGKTTLVDALDARRMTGVTCHRFDSVGVPSLEEMRARYGSPEAWQAEMLQHWLERLADGTPPGHVAVLDGQVRPSEVRSVAATIPALLCEIVLVDCAAEERDRRLREERRQPELANSQMNSWAAYLRGQADALGLQRLDTTERPMSVVLPTLVCLVEELRTRAG